MNDKRLGAYNRILKGSSSPSGSEESVSVAEKAARDARAVQKAESSVGTASRSSVAGGTRAKAGSGTTAGKGAGGNAGAGTHGTAGLRSGGGEGSARDERLKDTSKRLSGLIKVPQPAGAGPEGKESPFRKVAKFLLLIGVEDAAKVMSRLTPEQTERVVLEIASIRRVDPDEATIVLAEFESLLQQATAPTGGVETARSILDAAFGKERAEAMLRKAVPDIEGKPFEYLNGMDPDRLLSLIADELPAVKALVLSRIKPATAAQAIKRMPTAEKNDTVIRLAKLKAIDPEVMRRVDGAMREKVQNVSVSSVDSIDGRNALAEILRHMDSSGERSILDRLSDEDSELGRDLRERLFTIDDIVRADDRFLQETLRPMAERDLALLIAGKAEPFRKKILANVSRTRATLIIDEERIANPIPRAEAERVTSAFFITMRRAWEEGKFVIDGRDSDDIWV
jgi:flagellar motor switch protein FliG